MKRIVVFYLLLVACVAKSDVLSLYKIGNTNVKYVVSCVRKDGTNNIAEVFIAENITIHSVSNRCQFVMKNVDYLRTVTESASTLKQGGVVAQVSVHYKELTISYPSGTKVLYNGLIHELQKFELDIPNRTVSNHYEGDAALKEMEKLGVDLPDDIDTNSPTHAHGANGN